MCSHHSSRLDGGHIATEDHDDEDEVGGLTRRRALGMAGGGAVALMFAGVGGASSKQLADRLGPDVAEAAAASCVMTPAKDVGPYFVEEKLNRSNLVASSDGTNAQSGVPLALSLQVFDADNDCAAVTGATVDIWHANPAGLYSDESAQNTKGQTWLRGYQTTDSSGQVAFTTIWPGWYSGRAIHVHFKVRIYNGTAETLELTSRLYFPDSLNSTVIASNSAYSSRGNPDTTDSTDVDYGSNGSTVTLAPTSDGKGGYTASFAIGVSQSQSQLGNNGGSIGTGTGPGGTPPTTTTTTGTSSTSTGQSSATPTTTTVTTTGDKKVSAALEGVRMVRTSVGRRGVRVTVKSSEKVTAKVKLTRGGKTLAHKTVKLAKGTHRFRVPIAQHIKAGAATLHLTLSDSAGNSKTYKRTVHVRAKKS